MNNFETIKTRIKAQKGYLKKKYGVKVIGIFGSYIRNEQKKASDLDILVEFKSPISLLAFMSLENQLSKLAGKQVDLVMKSALKPHIGKSILKEVIYL